MNDAENQLQNILRGDVKAGEAVSVWRDDSRGRRERDLFFTSSFTVSSRRWKFIKVRIPFFFVTGKN